MEERDGTSLVLQQAESEERTVVSGGRREAHEVRVDPRPRLLELGAEASWCNSFFSPTCHFFSCLFPFCTRILVPGFSLELGKLFFLSSRTSKMWEELPAEMD